MKRKTPIYSGMLGGGIVVSIFLIIFISTNLFNYRIQIERVKVNSIQLSDSTYFKNRIDSFYITSVEIKQKLLDDLMSDKSILTPQEYTNNIVNYYNSLLLILSVMLAAFSVLSFVYIKSQTNDWVQEKLESNEFRQEVSEVLVGKAEDRFREVLSDLQTKLSAMDDKIAELNEQIDYNGNNEEIL